MLIKHIFDNIISCEIIDLEYSASLLKFENFCLNNKNYLICNTTVGPLLLNPKILKYITQKVLPTKSAITSVWC